MPRSTKSCDKVAALRRKASAAASEGFPGYCGTTGGQTGCDLARSQGYWEGVRSAQDCFALCAKCSACHYVSYSEANRGDCSWFRQCDTQRLQTELSRTHTTYRVRGASGQLRQLNVNASAAGIEAQVRELNCAGDWFERPERIWFHESSALHQYAHASRPNFRRGSYGPSALRAWAKQTLEARTPQRRPQHDENNTRWATCAVVGSAPSLLKRYDAREIDSHEAVIRVNRAPTGQPFARHVGRRTTLRLWGFMPLPEERHFPNETLAIYCPPVTWVSECWTSIGETVSRLATPLAASSNGSLALALIDPHSDTLALAFTHPRALTFALALIPSPTPSPSPCAPSPTSSACAHARVSCCGRDTRGLCVRCGAQPRMPRLSPFAWELVSLAVRLRPSRSLVPAVPTGSRLPCT